MLDLRRFREALEEMPEGTAITLPREKLIQLLGGSDLGSQTVSSRTDPVPVVDLSVRQVAALYGKSPNTVRRWLESGQLEGYKLFGREWRVPQQMLVAFQDDQRCRVAKEAVSRQVKRIDAWRNVS
jgi:excisionase family DNA binding protein